MCLTEISKNKFKTSNKYYCIVAKTDQDNICESLYCPGMYFIGEWYIADRRLVNIDKEPRYISGFHLFLSKQDALKYFKLTNKPECHKYYLASCSVSDIRIYGYEAISVYRFRTIVAMERKINNVEEM